MNTEPNNRTPITQKKLLSAYKLCGAILTVLVAIFGSLAYSDLVDSGEHYFRSSFATVALYVLIALAVVLAVLSAFLLKKNYEITLYGKSPRRFHWLTLCVALLPTVVSSVSKLTGEGSSTWITMIAVFSSLALIYPISKALGLSKTVTLIAGYLFIILCMVIIASMYVDFSVEMNSPSKVTLQFAIASAMLVTLYDLKGLIGRQKPSSFVSSSILNLVLTALCVVSTMIDVLPSPERYNSSYLLYALLLLAFALPAAIDFFTCGIVERANEATDDSSTDSPESTSTDSEETAVIEADTETENAAESNVTDSE